MQINILVLIPVSLELNYMLIEHSYFWLIEMVRKDFMFTICKYSYLLDETHKLSYHLHHLHWIHLWMGWSHHHLQNSKIWSSHCHFLHCLMHQTRFHSHQSCYLQGHLFCELFWLLCLFLHLNSIKTITPEEKKVSLDLVVYFWGLFYHHRTQTSKIFNF